MNILIANPFGIGDVLFVRPLVEALSKEPNTSIGFIGNARTQSLLEFWPELSWRGVFEKDTFRKRSKQNKLKAYQYLSGVATEIRAQHFDVLIDLSLGWHTGLVGKWAGIPKRIGFNYRKRGRFLTHKVPLEGFDARPVAAHYLALLSYLDVSVPEYQGLSMPLPQDSAQLIDTIAAAQDIPTNVPWLGVVPLGGASWGPNARYKQWPLKYFKQVLQEHAKTRQGHYLLFGGESEQSALAELANTLGTDRATCIQTPDLISLAACLQQCEWVFGNDSGPMHLAAALGTHTLSIFGPVDATVYRPLGRQGTHTVITLGLACQPCYQKFRFPECPWENACLQNLSANHVYETLIHFETCYNVPQKQ